MKIFKYYPTINFQRSCNSYSNGTIRRNFKEGEVLMNNALNWFNAESSLVASHKSSHWGWEGLKHVNKNVRLSAIGFRM